MKRAAAMVLAISLVGFVSTSAMAGPEDPSSFDPVQYEAQKVLYDWNYDKPEDGIRALGFIRNHLKAMDEYGDRENSKVVMVAHGNELHAFSRLNRDAYPEAYDALKEMADAGVEIHVCANAARGRGYAPEDFYDVITVVPAAVIDIAKYQIEGYSYMYPQLTSKMTRDDVVAKHPELSMD
ncbi:DsrE family protein [Aliihoeflea sp. 40Bstr573]|uniref:DsrE family protein n=1 Tax=Aliihoeflea sp. 40Bstr573 TaxID=2696467 RepID=UPI002095FE8D|nr:DsrE family protein [Aliihoeflea sp. 40Bstr573]MCO6388534.1 hypothetical protein [Aliihoeflea sp. 40Bstr573]